jgi:hypothetical protein
MANPMSIRQMFGVSVLCGCCSTSAGLKFFALSRISLQRFRRGNLERRSGIKEWRR